MVTGVGGVATDAAGSVGAAAGWLVEGGLVEGGLVEGGLVKGGLVVGGLVVGGLVEEENNVCLS